MTNEERIILNRAINRLVSDAIRLSNTAELSGSPRQQVVAAEIRALILRHASLFMYDVARDATITRKRKLTPRDPDFKLRG